MKTISLMFTFSVMTCVTLFCQTNVGIGIEDDLSVANMRAYSIGTFDNRDYSFKGSPLLWEDWMYASILLQGNQNFSDKEYRINYNGIEKILYVRIGNQVYDITLSKVARLKVDVTATDAITYLVLNHPRKGFGMYESIYEGSYYSLFAKEDMKLAKAYYNEALDAGDTRPSITKSRNLVLVVDGNIYMLPKKRRAFRKMYSDTRTLKNVIRFFDKNRVDLKDEQAVHLALIELNKNI